MSLASYFNFVLALIFVLGLIGAAAWAYRRFVTGGSIAGRLGLAGGRLGIVESRGIDARHRLVLVRRDGVEHLVLIGPTGETVIETGIVPPPAAPHAGAPR